MLGAGSGGSAAIQAAFDSKQNKSEKGQANGYAGLGSDGKVPSAQLPASQGGAAWGGVTGTLSDQADLQAALDAKAASDHTHEGGGGGPTVKSGIVSLGAGGTAAVLFGTPFGVGVTPHVVVCSQFNGADTSTTLFAHTISNVGFTMRGAGNAAGNVAWIATNAGNS